MSTKIRPSVPSSEVPPPLRHGEQLTRAEFERRYHAMPELKKAELIDGAVHMPSPVSFENHGRQHFALITWLGVYCAHTPGVLGANDATVRLDLASEPQPDAVLLIDPARGGRTTLSEGYITGPPELAAEVASSTLDIDRNAKLNAYLRNGVCEYLLWRVEDQHIDWFVRRDDQYLALEVPADGIVRSLLFAGLWLDVPAMLRGDGLAVLQALMRGLAAPEHAAFIEQLRRT